MGKATLFLVAAMVAAGLITQHFQTFSSDTNTLNSAYGEQVVARDIARSAYNLAMAEAKRDFAGAAASLAMDEKAFGGGTFDIVPTTYGSDSLVLEITSTAGEASYQIRTTLVEVSMLDAALIVEAPHVVPSINGPNVLITGMDTDPATDPQGLRGADQHGIKVNMAGIAGNFYDAFGAHTNHVSGIGGSGMQAISAGAFTAAVQDIYAEGLLEHDFVQSDDIDGNVTFGSVNAPAIVVAQDIKVKSGGHLKGYGLLLLDDEFEVKSGGTLDWEGLVIAKAETSIDLDYSGTVNIYGSHIVLQGSSAFTMPAPGKLHIAYLSSSAGFQSSVNIHPYGQAAQQVFAKGANKIASVDDVWEQHFEQGQQINFFIRTWPTWGAVKTQTPNYYDQYARGHESQVSLNPYADVIQLDDEGFHWRIGFEDLNEEKGYPSDWDYNDQIIEVLVIPDSTWNPNQTQDWWTADGGEEEGEEEEEEGEDEGEEVEGGGGGGEVVGATSFSFTAQGNVNFYYSTEAIARLNNRLASVRATRKMIELNRNDRPM